MSPDRADAGQARAEVAQQPRRAGAAAAADPADPGERGGPLSEPVPPEDETTPLPLPLARRVDEVCCRFEAAWKAAWSGGEAPRLEAYLAEVEGPARAALLGELLKVEAHHRRRAGEEPRGDDYRGRLGDLDPDWLATVLGPAGPERLPQGPADTDTRHRHPVRENPP